MEVYLRRTYTTGSARPRNVCAAVSHTCDYYCNISVRLLVHQGLLLSILALDMTYKSYQMRSRDLKNIFASTAVLIMTSKPCEIMITDHIPSNQPNRAGNTDVKCFFFFFLAIPYMTITHMIIHTAGLVSTEMQQDTAILSCY